MGRKALIDVDEFRRVVQSDLDSLDNDLRSGKCKDFADYKLAVGQVKGTQRALERFAEQLRKGGEDDET